MKTVFVCSDRKTIFHKFSQNMCCLSINLQIIVLFFPNYRQRYVAYVKLAAIQFQQLRLKEMNKVDSKAETTEQV